MNAKYFALCLTLAFVFVCCSHVAFISLFEEYMNPDGTLKQAWLVFVPVIMICFAHSIVSVLHVPIVSNYVETKKQVPRVMSICKIMEGTSISLTMVVTGFLRQHTGSYLPVSCLILVYSCLGGYGSLHLFWHGNRPNTLSES